MKGKSTWNAYVTIMITNKIKGITKTIDYSAFRNTINKEAKQTKVKYLRERLKKLNSYWKKKN